MTSKSKKSKSNEILPREVREQVGKSALPPKSYEFSQMLRWMIDNVEMNYLSRDMLVRVFNTMAYKLERFKRWEIEDDDERDLLIDLSVLLRSYVALQEGHDTYEVHHTQCVTENADLKGVLDHKDLEMEVLEEEISAHRERLVAYKIFVKELKWKIGKLEGEIEKLKGEADSDDDCWQKD